MKTLEQYECWMDIELGNCQNMIFFKLLFQPISPSFKDNYLMFHRHLFNNFIPTVMTLTILMTSPLHEIEWINIWDATDYVGLNVGLLNDLLNSILCDLSLSILFIPD